MSAIETIIGAPVTAFFALFGPAPPWLSLTVIAALLGVAMLWVFARTSNPAAIRAAKRKLLAHLLELRLFGDDPVLMWRAQRDLLKANLRYFALMMRPALVVALPVVLLLARLDAYYGRAPLETGRAAIVTMRLSAHADSGAPPTLVPPAAVAVETPPVRVLSMREVSWRIRPARDVSDVLRFRVGQETIEKRIEAGAGFRLVPGRRSRSFLSPLLDPGEPRLKSEAVEWIDVRRPPAEFSVLGFNMHWLVWFTLVSLVTMLALRKRFGVVL